MSDKEAFIEKLYPVAEKVSRETGVSKELILAQAAQETGWGEHVLPGTHNIFNIKAGGGWAGPTKTFNVWEIENGKKLWKDQTFRVYGSDEEALSDRVKFLRENPRYAKAGLFDDGTRGDFAREAAALQKAGYATDPNYARQLAAVYVSPIMQRAIEHSRQKERSTTPMPAQAAQHAGLLAQGDRSEAVRTLQIELTTLGYRNAHGHALKTDGKLGANTKRAVKAFQHEHHLTVDGKVGPHTQAALDQALEAHHAHAPLPLTDSRHADHALFAQALAGVHRIDADMGRMPDQHSTNLAAALTVAAKQQGMTRIDQIAISPDGARTSILQTDLVRPKVAQVVTALAVHTPMEQSSVSVIAASRQTLPEQPMQSGLEASAPRVITNESALHR